MNSTMPFGASPHSVGPYRRIRLLGTGGVADVWLAFDRRRREQVALKFLRPQYARDEGLLRRFHREAAVITALESPHIVRFYGLEEFDGLPVLVMEYVPGADLKILLKLDGPIEPIHALRLMRQIAAGAASAHCAGLVHRDLKPANVLMTHDGIAKITDFGIAHEVAGAQLTDPGQAWGTSAYLAPEQATGQTVTPATDIYSLGVILFEMLTGQVPYAGDDPVQVALAHIQKPVPSVHTVNPLIPPGIEQLVARMMAKKPSARPADGDALVAILDRYLEGGDSPTVVHDSTQYRPLAQVHAPSADRPERARPAPGRWILPFLTFLLIGAGFVAAQGGFNAPMLAASPPASGDHKGLALASTATLTVTPSHTPTATPTPQPTRREGNGADTFAQRPVVAPLLDGGLADWGESAFVAIENLTFAREQWTGPADLSGNVAFAWDREALYVAVERRDEAHVQQHAGTEIFRGDAVELWLDVDVSGDYSATEVNGDDFQIAFSAGDFGALRAEAFVYFPAQPDAARNRQVRVRAVPQPNGYMLEAAIPWELLGALPKSGLTLGYAVVLSDIDDPEVTEIQTQATTSLRSPYLNPQALGNLILTE